MTAKRFYTIGPLTTAYERERGTVYQGNHAIIREDGFAIGCMKTKADATLAANAPRLLQRLKEATRLLQALEENERERGRADIADAICRVNRANLQAIAKAE